MGTAGPAGSAFSQAAVTAQASKGGPPVTALEHWALWRLRLWRRVAEFALTRRDAARSTLPVRDWPGSRFRP